MPSIRLALFGGSMHKADFLTIQNNCLIVQGNFVINGLKVVFGVLDTRPRGYKTFFILNSAEIDIKLAKINGNFRLQS